MQKVFLSDVLKTIKKAYIWNDEISQQILERAMMQLPPADDVLGWTPMSEGPPREDGKYLCCWKGETVDTGYFLNGHFRLYGENKDKLITAWMPLPEPYEED